MQVLKIFERSAPHFNPYHYSREIHEVDLQFDHVISCDIELQFDIDATTAAACHKLALQIEVDVA